MPVSLRSTRSTRVERAAPASTSASGFCRKSRSSARRTFSARVRCRGLLVPAVMNFVLRAASKNAVLSALGPAHLRSGILKVKVGDSVDVGVVAPRPLSNRLAHVITLWLTFGTHVRTHNAHERYHE